MLAAHVETSKSCDLIVIVGWRPCRGESAAKGLKSQIVRSGDAMRTSFDRVVTTGTGRAPHVVALIQ